MEWIILLYETPRRDKPVEDFIKNQQTQAQAKILHHLNLLQHYGSQLGMPHAKILNSGVYELRVRGKEELRIFYCFSKRTIYLLHDFKKQTDKTPTKELSIAIERSKSILT